MRLSDYYTATTEDDSTWAARPTASHPSLVECVLSLTEGMSESEALRFVEGVNKIMRPAASLESEKG